MAPSQVNEARFYVGQRLSYAQALCTVRYVGPLEGTKGLWLGVEWDDPHRGKHDGRHAGHRIFKCLSPSPTVASFIRPTRVADPPRSFMEALRFKYTGMSRNGIEDPDPHSEAPIAISGKRVEEVGFDRIKQQQAALENLKVAILADLNVHGLQRGDTSHERVEQAQQEIRSRCPSISELDLSWNPIERWENIVQICVPLENLHILRASGLRMWETQTSYSQADMSPFLRLQELYLDGCLLTAEQVSQLFSNSNSSFPCLSTLSLSSNNLATFPTLQNGPSSVRELMLEDNWFKDLYYLRAICSSFIKLSKLSLQGNRIQNVGLGNETGLSSTLKFPVLNTLNLSRNQIRSYAFIDDIPEILPNLTALQISHNPINEVSASTYESPPSIQPHTSFYLTLARIPQLKSLNYTIITPRDREEGEIYYLAMAEKDIKPGLESIPSQPGYLEEAISSWHKRYPRYDELCEKYDRDSIFAKYLSTASTSTNGAPVMPIYPPSSLRARLIKTTFYIHPSSPSGPAPPSITHSIPRTIDIYTLKGWVARQFRSPSTTLQPLQFRLIYESPELDPVREDTGDPEDWERWGDWDVDAVGDGQVQLSSDEAVDGKWIDGFLLRDGRKWRRREIELLDGWREWGFWLEEGVREATVRVEPFQDA